MNSAPVNIPIHVFCEHVCISDGYEWKFWGLGNIHVALVDKVIKNYYRL